MCSVRFLSIVALCVAGSSVSAGPALGDAELRDCARLSLVGQQATARADATLANFAAMRAAIDRQTAAIEAERARIDRRNPVQVAQFNQQVVRACAEYQAYVTAFNAAIADDNRRSAVFNASCADREFDPVKVASLPPALRTAWRTATGEVSATETAVLLATDLPPMPQPLSR